MRTIKLLSVIVLVSGCANLQGTQQTWEAFVAQGPGQPLRNGADEYLAGTVRVVPAFAAGYSSSEYLDTFARWCKRAGGASPSTDSVSSAFASAASSWSNNAFMTRRHRTTKATATCFDQTSGRLLGAVLIDKSNGIAGSSKQGPIYEPVVAYYSEEQAKSFAERYHSIEQDRAKRTEKEAEERRAEQAKNTRLLRANPKIGDKVSIGVIIDLRPPLALVQYFAQYRELFGLPQAEWKNISELEAAQ